MIKRILHLIEQAGSLMEMPRSHKRTLGTTYDTIASHSHHVAVIAYCLARLEGLTHNQAMKALTMGVFHDLAEARTGDMDFIAKHYCSPDEVQAVKDQFSGFSFGSDLQELLEEYEEQKTLEARCAKDADSLEQLYQEWVLTWQGNKLAERWYEGDYNNRVPKMKTESAKKLAYELKKSHPHEWWWTQFVKHGKPVDQSKLTGK